MKKRRLKEVFVVENCNEDSKKKYYVCQTRFLGFFWVNIGWFTHGYVPTDKAFLSIKDVLIDDKEQAEKLLNYKTKRYGRYEILPFYIEGNNFDREGKWSWFIFNRRHIFSTYFITGSYTADYFGTFTHCDKLAKMLNS